MSNTTWDDEKKTLVSVTEEPFRHPYHVPSARELRVRKHIARLQSADDMLADGQISKVERDNIRNRMLQVIEDPNA